MIPFLCWQYGSYFHEHCVRNKPIFLGGAAVFSADSIFYSCVRMPVLVTGMAHPEGRIFLTIVIYSGNI